MKSSLSQSRLNLRSCCSCCTANFTIILSSGNGNSVSITQSHSKWILQNTLKTFQISSPFTSVMSTQSAAVVCGPPGTGFVSNRPKLIIPVCFSQSVWPSTKFCLALGYKSVQLIPTTAYASDGKQCTASLLFTSCASNYINKWTNNIKNVERTPYQAQAMLF